MDKKEINYTALINSAMLSVVRSILSIVEKQGLFNDHHFYITFVTNDEGVVLSDSLRKKFPSEMSIVLQRRFSDLKVEEDGFFVTLFFNGNAETLYIPFKSIIVFSDPSVKFDLHFRFGYSFMKKIDQLLNGVKESDNSKASRKTITKKKSAKVLSLKEYRDKVDAE